ncbi:MAG: Depupylase [Fimbriimonadaceae bacterium]|nr:Depupylase [Fimbriimonadaceae bacterium]
MNRILAGIETEYGFSIPGRGAVDQIDDAVGLVSSYPGPSFIGWDYRFESPRSDLRGFTVERLAEDPIDREFDRAAPPRRMEEVRADRVLANGARFYNDHGHPEYATPECWSLAGLAAHDRAGEFVVLRSAEALGKQIGAEIDVYKNNTDYHGASYGTHENYLVPRSIGFENLVQALLPLFVVRPLLCGAGKVGSEHGAWVDFQASQRADFFAEPVNAETLYRRPIFNTRDEPHADPSTWIRLHVICGDANRIEGCTRRKAALVKIALMLALIGEIPNWALADPVHAAQIVSRRLDFGARIDLQGGSWTTARHIVESYLDHADRLLDLDDELRQEVDLCRRLMDAFDENFQEFSRSVDWAAKYNLLLHYREEEGIEWRDPAMQAVDLEYHELDPVNGLFEAMVESGAIEPQVGIDIGTLLTQPESTRAMARSQAVTNFRQSLVSCCWRSLTLDVGGRSLTVDLEPDREYKSEQPDTQDVLEWIRSIAPAK